ncbi:MAG: phosphoribosylaminoimidazolesuccinocarboxamide synthase [Candidatus Omnitrophica bacterium]|nr:phosphoribosylaminoimidazolesuccinocarboxamide synthase [Candidatus Omnitrophota bacterium]MCF7878171.1 phosphoribosylaminoimidazolesuccinocarboxamide synthase [Candidatus Omnitrophota bacterium]MCF7892609.1 phosphoribosylaminoimidazolesuccinocarboxamide synthase [Candidatus Omnitrophota bacterium]
MLKKTDFNNLKLFKKGKVRDVYDLGNKLLIVATDRISCFDAVLPTPIPNKGKILTQISLFWFSYLKDLVSNHLISADDKDLPKEISEGRDELRGRFMIAEKCKVFPFECVVRGYLAGSGFKDYQKTGSVCGIKLPQGLKQADKLPEPIFTPATKAESGHDQNIDFEYMKKEIGENVAEKLKNISIQLYKKATELAESKGIIIADTKFEFGKTNDNRIIIVDEALTPDSSRFWPRSEYGPGKSQSSFDKQFVRDYLETCDWDKTPPAPELPEDIVKKTRNKYNQALEMLTENG